MKKTLLLTIAFSLIFGLAVTASAATLEKIPNLESLGDYERIVKKGTELWGYKKVEKVVSTEGLEKIVSLDDVKYFTKIKKIDGSLWGVRIVVKKIEDDKIECVKTAITTKDDALVTAFNTYSDAVVVALTARTTCQEEALASNDQFAANKTCISNYQKEIKAQNGVVKKARSDAWKTYTVELKKCSPSAVNFNDGGNDL